MKAPVLPSWRSDNRNDITRTHKDEMKFHVTPMKFVQIGSNLFHVKQKRSSDATVEIVIDASLWSKTIRQGFDNCHTRKCQTPIKMATN
jgi:hypothetical protein